jgi:hypothetical protein
MVIETLPLDRVEKESGCQSPVTLVEQVFRSRG